MTSSNGITASEGTNQHGLLRELGLAKADHHCKLHVHSTIQHKT